MTSLKPTHVKFGNSESNDLPQYLKTTHYPSYHTSKFKSKLPQKKYCPEQNYGVSYESPTYFRAKHTLINQNSYKNPYLTNPENYDFSTVTASTPNFNKPLNTKLSYTQTFKIGEDFKSIEGKIFEKTKLPAVTTYNCILDKKNHLKESELFVQENSSFEDDFNKFSKDPHSFHLNQGLFGDFVERNNIMNVFGNLLKRERNQTFVDRSREFSNTQNSVDKTQKSKISSKRNFSNGDILKNVNKGENSLESISTILTKKPIESQGIIFIQNGSSVELSNLKYPHMKKFKLNELKPIPFSLAKHLKKLKENTVKYAADVEKFCENDKKYMNTVNNSILKSKILETIQQKPLMRLPHSYSTPKVHVVYKEKNLDLDKFESVSKFYKFLEPMSRRELQKRYKIKEQKELKKILKNDSSINNTSNETKKEETTII